MKMKQVLEAVELDAAFEDLEAIPWDADGSRWYWELTRTPLAVRIRIWRADGDNWRQPAGGPCVEAEGDTVLSAVRRGLSLVAEAASEKKTRSRRTGRRSSD